MKPDQAEQNLQVIRTLMERSTIYRRALGPMMLWAGSVGLVAAIGGQLWCEEGMFGWWWLGACVVAMAGALWLARREAIRQAEPFWSAPMRRVASAFLPAMTAGAVITGWVLYWELGGGFLTPAWAILYGCALHAAGQFTPRALRYAGWAFVLAGTGLCLVAVRLTVLPHLWMGALFGGLHLACGVYLLATEKRSNAA